MNEILFEVFINLSIDEKVYDKDHSFVVISYNKVYLIKILTSELPQDHLL